MIISLANYVNRIAAVFPELGMAAPWKVVQEMEQVIHDRIGSLGSDFKIFNNVAIHKTVIIDSHAILKGPAIISKDCFIGAHTYLRGGVFLDENVSLGPGCEVKTSCIFSGSALAHFNYVGDSLLGSGVNLEAGAVIANHYNERKDPTIFVCIDGELHATDVRKFGALVGDHTKLGANSVLSPGTILKRGSIVRRLELIEQCPEQPL